MATWPLGRFVDRPAPDAIVRYECNDADATAPRRLGPDFTLGVPTLDGDPDAVGVSWGFREPSFTQRVKGPKRAALEALAGLSRELLRRTNWFEFKLDQQTLSVWLKIYRSSYEPLSLARVWVDTTTGDEVVCDEGDAPAKAGYRLMPDTWEIQVPLLADAFALGERVTLPPMTFAQSLTGLSATLPAIKGDAPAPLRIQLAPATGFAAGFGPAWLTSVMTGPSGFDAHTVDIGTGDGLSGGTTGSGATYLGGTYRAFSPTANPAVTTLGGPLPVIPAGQYRVLVRGEFDRPADLAPTYRLRFSIGRGIGGSVAVTPITFNAAAATTSLQWVDLGAFSIPANAVALPQDVTVPTGPQQALLTMAVDTTVPNGSVRLDAMQFIPIDCSEGDSRTLMVGFDPNDGGSALGANHVGTIDGDDEVYWGAYSGGILFPGAVKLTGGFPVVDPAADQNLLTVFATDRGYSLGTGTTIMSVGASVQVVPSYHPRYLHVPGDA